MTTLDPALEDSTYGTFRSMPILEQALPAEPQHPLDDNKDRNIAKELKQDKELRKKNKKSKR